MPYTKKYNNKSKGYYGPVAKRANIYGPAAMQLAKDVAYLGTLINSEPKFHAVTATDNYSWLGKVIDLSLIPQGDTTNTRDGNTVLPRFLSVRVNLWRPSSATSTHSNVRLLIFRYWGELSGSPDVPSPAEILNDNGTTYAPFAHLNEDNTGSRGDHTRRIEVLRSEICGFDAVSNTQCLKDFNIEMNGTKVQHKQHMKFHSSSTATPNSGAVYAMFISDQSLEADSAYKLSSKLTFYDN